MFLTLFYEPYSRIPILLLVFATYLYVMLRKKHTQYKYDEMIDLEMMRGVSESTLFHYKVFADSKNNFITSSVYIDGVYGYDFSLKFENRWEKRLKSLQLIHECQSGDKKFDEMIFVVSDDAYICKILQDESSYREAIFKLFWYYKEKGHHIQELRYFDGRLILHTRTKKSVNDDSEREMINLCHFGAPKVQKIADYLPKRVKQESPLYREKTGLYFYIIFLFFTFLLTNGLTKLLLESSSAFIFPRLLHRYDFLLTSIEMSAVGLVLYLFILFKLFYKSSRLAKAIFLGMSLGAFSLFG